MWSSGLQSLIASKDQQVVLYDLEGNVTKSFDVDGFRIHLSPSGKRLFVMSKSGGTWLDLETGQSVNIAGKVSPGSFGWSADETRLFDSFCLIDAKVGKISCMSFPLAVWAGEGLSTIYWVAGDKVMLDWPTFFEGTPSPDNPPIVLLIDPLKATYQDVRVLAGFDRSAKCGYASDFPTDRNHIWLLCDQKPYVIDLRTFDKQAVPSDLEFVSWSPDSQFALTKQYDPNCCTGPRHHVIYSLATTEAYSITSGVILSPTWSSTGSLLAYLAEDQQQLGVLDAATRGVVQIFLPQPVANIYWHPQNHGLVVQTDDNSLWSIADPSVNRIEQLTAPLPEVRDVKWSPNGDKLAFVSGSDVYIVTVSK
jgi:WD40 repeat protein